jgi:hypothetical protein
MKMTKAPGPKKIERPPDKKGAIRQKLPEPKIDLKKIRNEPKERGE